MESELVSGFMTEHAAGIFVFFFLAEYASIILMCILISIVLLGGYEIFSFIYFIVSIPTYILSLIFSIIYSLSFGFEYLLTQFIELIKPLDTNYFLINIIKNINAFNVLIYKFILNDILYILDIIYIPYIYNSFYISIINVVTLSTKTCILIFTFIWVRASYPRIRFDQLMSYCWTVLLPIIIAIIIFIPCILYTKDTLPCVISLL